MRLIDADEIKLEKGFFENINNVPKFFEWLGKQPTIDPVKHGRWILDGEYDDLWWCSECGYEFTTEGTDIPTYFYCPDCGAKMDEVTE